MAEDDQAPGNPDPMPHDPLLEHAIAPAPGSPDEKEAVEADGGVTTAEQYRLQLEAKRDDLFARSRDFVAHDVALASDYAHTSPTRLRELARAREVPLVDKWTHDDLVRVMVYLDQVDRLAGRTPIAVEEPPQRVPPPKPAPRIPGVPRSPTGQWRVIERHPSVALPGGCFVVPVGAIYSIEQHGEELIKSIVEQGVKLAAHPNALERKTCDECETSWLVEANGTECPVCCRRALMSEVQGEIEDAERRADTAERRAAAANDELQAARDLIRERELTVTELTDELAGVRGELEREREDRAREREMPPTEPMPAGEGPASTPTRRARDRGR